MNPTRQRRILWARRGALVLAGLAILLGLLFAVLIEFAQHSVPPDADIGFWGGLVGRTVLLWGGGGLFFGALLGMYASMIWPDDTV